MVGELNQRRRKQTLQKQKEKQKTNVVDYLVAVVFYGNYFGLRTLEDPKLIAQILHDLNGNKAASNPFSNSANRKNNCAIQSFWTNYDKHYNYGCKHIKSSSKHLQVNFQDAMDKVLSLLEDEIGNEKDDQFVILDSFYSDDNGAGQGGVSMTQTKKKLISPDGCDDEDEQMDDQDGDSVEEGEEYNTDNHDKKIADDQYEKEKNHNHQRRAKAAQEKGIARSMTRDFGNEQNEVENTKDESPTSSQEFGDDGTVDDEEVLVYDGETSDAADQSVIGSSSISSISEDGDSPIKKFEPWHRVWDKFKEMGWSWKWKISKIGIDERSYFKVNGEKVDGKRFWSEEELKSLAEKEYGWTNPERQAKQASFEKRRLIEPKRKRKLSAEPERKRKRSPEQSDKAKSEKKQKNSSSKNAKSSKSDSKFKVDKKPKSIKAKSTKVKPKSKQRIWGKETKVKEKNLKQTPQVKMNFGAAWRYLQSKNWKYIPSRNPLHENWYYLKPHVKFDKNEIEGIEGVDYFITRDSLYEYLGKNDHYLSSPDSSSYNNSGSGTDNENENECTSPTQCLRKAGLNDNSEMFCTPTSNFDEEGDDDDDDDDEIMEDSNDSCWWMSFPIPTWKEVRPIVMKMNKAKMLRLNGNFFTVPWDGEEHTLNSLTAFRQFLCVHGISMEPGEVLNKDDLETLSRWISITHLPHTVDGVRLERESSLEILPDIPVLDSKQAWSLLCDKFNCSFENNQFHIPSITKPLWSNDKPITCFDSIEDARKCIRSYGIKNVPRDDQCHVSIILWSSLADVFPFHYVEADNEGAESNERLAAELSSSSSSSIPIQVEGAGTQLYEKCWWISTKFPQFKEVWTSLKKVVSYSKSYIVKSNGKTHRFDSPQDLQMFLSLKGIEIKPEHDLSDNERELISRWLSIAHLPTRINKHHISSQAGVDLLLEKDPMDSDEAWELLCSSDYESKMCQQQFYVPRVNESLYDHEYMQFFDSIEEVRKYIRSHGIKRLSKHADNVNHVRLILWASLADVNPFIEDSLECEKSNDDENKGANELSNDQPKDTMVQSESKESSKDESAPSHSHNKKEDEQGQILTQESNEDNELNRDPDEEFFDNQERKERFDSLLFTQEEEDRAFCDILESFK